MLKALILICSITVTPDLHDCDRDNANDVIVAPDRFANPYACLSQAQEYFAQTTMGRSLTSEERVVIRCVREEREPS